MADAKIETIPSGDVEGEEKPVSRGMPRMIILAGMIVLILAEVLVGYFILIPSAQSTAQGTDKELNRHTGVASEGVDGALVDPGEINIQRVAQFEFALPETFDYSIPDGEKITSYTYKFVLLLDEQNQKDFEEKFAKVSNQVQHAIIKVIQTVPKKELEDPNLTVVQNRIREKVNNLLEKPYVNGVIFTKNEKIVM